MSSDDPNKPPPPPTPSRRFPSEDGSSILSCSKRRLSDDSEDSTNSSKIGRATPFKKLKKSSVPCNPPLPPPSVAKKKSRSTGATSNGDDCQNVKVVARVRPLSDKEKKEKSSETIVCNLASSSLTIDGNRSFEYDSVFAPDATQREVYERTAGDSVRRNILRGFNTTILAYGQTGSGKTFTMGTECGNESGTDDAPPCREDDLVPPAEGDGIIPRAVYDVFRTQKDMRRQEVKVELSYLEIYNEEIRDLLSAESEKEPSIDLAIRDRADGGVSVTGLTSVVVHSPKEVSQLMESAAGRRATASTAMNAVSSRSHAICTLNVTISPSSQQSEATAIESGVELVGNNDGTETVEMSGEQICAKLTLVDLAGSERIKRTGAEGARMKEGISINKGLFVLGQVVSSLSEMGQQSEHTGSTHIPYRDSKLTRLLQDSLGGNSRTVMVACVSPADTNTEESLNTLRYAQRTRNIKNSARRNIVAAPLSAAEAAALRRENQMLKLQLSQARAKSSVSSTAQSLSVTTSLTSAHTSSSVRDSQSFVEGLNVEKLEIVSRLRASCKSLQTKVEKLEEQVQSSVEDALCASLRSDRWQLKHEQVVAAAKAAGISISDEHDLKDKLDIVSAHRKELSELKNQLLETQADAAMARATAAAIVAGGGDLMSAEVIALETEDFDELNGDCKGGDYDPRQQDQLASELVAMSGEIEQKEAMARQMNQERECMEDMQSHFEAALESLQQEVHTLSVERGDLQAKLEGKKNPSKNGKSVPNSSDAEKKKMKGRISDLEKRIKELNRKASEHTRAIRMKDAAERKCVQLAAEIVQDKKRRAALQRKMKEEAEERRSEKKAARLRAARMLRDSQKLQYELNKVKDAAAKQATVLKRKMDAMLKQQSIEGKRKRPGLGSSTSSKSVSSKISRGDASTGAKRDGLENWLDGEIESAALVKDTRLQIEEQSNRLSEAFSAKEDILSKMDAGDNSSSAPAALRSIESEIDSRTKVLQQLQRSLSDIQQAAQKLSTNTEKIPPSLSSAGFVDIATWLGLSRSELRFVSGSTFNRLISFKQEVDRIKTRHEDAVASAVNAAISKERRGTDEVISKLKMEHAEAIMTLLESTKGAIEQKLSHSILEAAEGGIDQSVRCAVDDMLGSYLRDCSKVGSEVRGDLLDVKHKQEGMKKVVDQVAGDIIAKNEAAAIAKPKKTKKRQKHNRDVESDYDAFEFEDDHVEDLIEDSDDSDWSPDTPAPKKRRPAKKEKMDPDTSIEESTEGETNESGLGGLTVSRLREMLRTRGLPVSGKKKDLVVRLKEAMSTSPGEDSDQSKENHHPVSSTPSKTPSKRRALRQPLANKNIDDPSNNHVMDETIVFSAKKKRRGNDAQLSRGAVRRKNMADALSKALSDAENMI